MLKKPLLSSADCKGKYYTYNIMLGSACNWSCPYCIQSVREFKQADPNEFCDKFLHYLEKSKRVDKINTFCFWGGEPLLYYKNLFILLERLSVLNIRDPMRISSNGSLLTEDNYHVFNKYFTKFEISYHEGQLTWDKWKLALKIERLVVSSLISHKVLDWSFYYDKWQEICDKFGRYVKWYIFPMIYAGAASKEYALTKDDIDRYIDSLYRHLDDLDNIFYRTALQGLIFDSSAKGLNKYKNYCYNEQSIAIDLFGNRYSCHHDYSDQVKVGNIFNAIPITWEPPIDKSCIACEAYPICVGGCFRCNNRFLWCYYQKKIYQFLQYVKKNNIDQINSVYKELL